jgi:hypothetical protein
MAHSILKNKPELMKVVAILVLLRAYLPLIDIEGRRYSYSDLENCIFFVCLINGLLVQQVINNLIMDRKYMIPQTILTVFMTSIGFNRLFNKNDIPFLNFY